MLPENEQELNVLLDALCEESLSPKDAARLEQLVRGNPEARMQYLTYLYMDATLRWDRPEGICQSVGELSTAESPALQSSKWPVIEVDSPRIIPQAGLFSNAIHGAMEFFPPEALLSYAVGAVLVSLGLWVGSLIYVSHPSEVASSPPPSPSRVTAPTKQYIGRITGMANAKWAADSSLKIRDSGSEKYPPKLVRQRFMVALGDKFSLASGLLEISYDSGAKVVLQGPAIYEVESRSGGFLSVGKLTAKLEKREEGREESSGKVASGQWSVASESSTKSRNPEIPKSPIPNPSSSPVPHPHSPAPAFTVRTPTALVTDLGTEFGIEVRDDHAADVYVFQGVVDVTSLACVDRGKSQVRHRLTAGKGVSVTSAGNIAVNTKLTKKKYVGLRGFYSKPSTTAQIDLLLQDTFQNEADADKYDFSGDYGLNFERFRRQTGRLASAGWYVRSGHLRDAPNYAQMHHAGHPDGLCLFADYGQVGCLVIDCNFPSNVEYLVDVDPVAYRYDSDAKNDTTRGGWVALSVRGQGTQPDSPSLPIASNAGAVLVIRSNGGWEYWENGFLIRRAAMTAADRYKVRMRNEGNRLEIFVNDVVLDLDPSGPATVRILQGTAAEPTHNFIGIGVHNDDGPPGERGRQVSVLYELRIKQIKTIPSS